MLEHRFPCLIEVEVYKNLHGRHINFACYPLCLYLNEYKENEIHLLYLHIYTLFYIVFVCY